MLPDQFTSLPDLVRMHSARTPTKAAIIMGTLIVDWQSLDALADRVACYLAQHPPGNVVAISSPMEPWYLSV